MVEEDILEYSEQPDDADEESKADDLRSRALTLLDFHLVRQHVANRVTFFPARRLAFQMTPSHRSMEVDDLQKETAEGLTLLEIVGEVDLYSAADTTTAVARAGIGGVLTGVELLEVADSLEVHRRARAAVLRSRDKAPMLADIVEGIPDLQELRRQISRKLDARGEVVDDATPTLRALRRQVQQAYDRVTQTLRRIIRSTVGQEALQEPIITTRSERVVVPVKAEMRQRIPGIVHDASNTGATVFIEPFATVELGNNWRELVLEEEREVFRVLRDLSTLVGELAEDIRRGDELTAMLDFILARARYSLSIHGIPSMPRRNRRHAEDASDAPDMSVRLLGARHPLLGRSATPININIGPDWSVLVITGPNTGGKTVAMKTVGLLALMHQSGLQIPADDGSTLPVFDGIYADVGDQQSIEQSVSTFSSHMRNVIEILDEVSPASLVLLDELGTSTDPEEGSALAKAVLDHLASNGVSVIATTHHRNVATHTDASPSMMNASVQLDLSTLEPTYILTMGVPGRSYAMAVASKLGLSEEIMESAQSLLEPQHRRFEDWLNELQGNRQQLQTRLQETEEARAQAETIRQELEAQLDYLITHREDILDSMRRDMLSQYEDARRKLRRAEAALSWSAPAGDPKEAIAEIAEARQELQAKRLSPPTPPPRRRAIGPLVERPIAVGDTVDIRGLNLKGTLVSLPEQGNEAEVNIGKVRLRIDLSRLSRIEEPLEADKTPDIHIEVGPSLGTMELDLRGLRAEESLVRLEEFLDSAVRDGLSTVRIIHGRGTGVLRQVVREHLTRHALVRSFEQETRERGGSGATSVELA